MRPPGESGRDLRLVQNAGVSEMNIAVVVGLDVGGTKTNATVLTEDGRFLVDDMVEVMSCVLEGPTAAIAAIDEAMERVLAMTATPRSRVRAVVLAVEQHLRGDRGAVVARGHLVCEQLEPAVLGEVHALEGVPHLRWRDLGSWRDQLCRR